MIEAAGGVVWRIGASRDLEVLLVHRPRHDDWSLPKGKLHVRETAVAAAVREVREETGLRCEVGPELPSTHYVDRKGRDKRVRYWAMHCVSGRFKTNREVDRTEWLPLGAALSRLTERRDADIVAALDHLLATVS